MSGEIVSRRNIVKALAALGFTSLTAYALGGSNEPTLPTNPKPPVLKAPKLTAVVINPTRATQLIQPLDEHYRSTVERIPGSYEITGPFPIQRFTFSKEVIEAGLVPIVFVNEDIDARIYQATSYIGKLHSLLNNRPELRGPKLWELGVNTPDNFPIEFDQKADLETVLEAFLTDQMFGNIHFNRLPVRGTSYLFGTIGSPEYEKNAWKIVAEVGLNTLILDEKISQEERQTAYYQTTNLQFALKMLHEYSHYKQDQGLMSQILRDNALMEQVGQDPTSMRNMIMKKAQENVLRVSVNAGIPNRNVAVNEAQANAVSQLFLHILTQINRTDRFPGAEDDDPYPISQDALLRVYRRDVVYGSTTFKKALNPGWLLKHSNWGQ